MVHQDVAIEELNEGLIPKNVPPDGDRLNPEFHTEYRSVLGKLNWLQSRTQFHISYAFSRLASASAAPTVKDMKELNKAVRLVKTRPQRMYYWRLQGKLRLLAYPDASYRNNADHSSQRGQ
eukprot:5391118-Amphidinium_carterae.1